MTVQPSVKLRIEKVCLCERELGRLVWKVYLLQGNFLKSGLPEDKKRKR